MSLSAAVVDALVAAGVTVEQLAAAIKADLAEGEARAQVKRAKDASRQRKCRSSRSVTVTPRDKADPPIEVSYPPSDPEGSGASPPDDEIKLAFDRGIAVLTAAGHSERQARSMVGKWTQTHGAARTREALDAASGKPDPLPYVQAILAKPKSDLDDLMASVERKYPARAPPNATETELSH